MKWEKKWANISGIKIVVNSFEEFLSILVRNCFLFIAVNSNERRPLSNWKQRINASKYRLKGGIPERDQNGVWTKDIFKNINSFKISLPLWLSRTYSSLKSIEKLSSQVFLHKSFS